MRALYFISNVFNDIAAVALFTAGIYFTFRFDFFQFKGLGKIFSKTVGSIFGKDKNREVFKLFSASLAGAAGVGNITGVASAIAVGGPGAIFWMWIAAFLGMATKYAETRLAVMFKSSKNGYNTSPMTYIKKISGSDKPAYVFAFFGISVSFLMGNLIQSRSACESIKEAVGISETISGPILCLIIVSVIFGGFKAIESFAEKAVPIMTVLYIAMCTAVLVMYKENIPSAFAEIFICAFRPSAATGGIVGTTIITSIRSGISKGIFSNEAGLGSAALAYGNTANVSAEEQGLWGAFDVFADTVIISTFSALTILVSQKGAYGSVICVFTDSFGNIGGIVGAVCIALFAAASIIIWEYYGEACFAFITRGKLINVFRAVFCVFLIFGAILTNDVLWPIADIANTLMMSVNIYCVLKNDVKKENLCRKAVTQS